MRSLFLLGKEQICIFQPWLEQLLALTVGWAALPSLLPLIWGIRNNIDLPTLLVNLFLK